MLLLDISALALGDPSVTVQEVTPPTLAAGALFPTEVHMFWLLFCLPVLHTAKYCHAKFECLWLVTCPGKDCPTLWEEHILGCKHFWCNIAPST